MRVTRALMLGLQTYIVGQGFQPLVVVGGMPATPDEAVALNLYNAIDPIEVARMDVRVQAMCRGVVDDSLSGTDVADDLFDILHGLEDLWIGDLHIAICSRISVVPLGIDNNKRTTRADNYELMVDVPVTARRPA